MPRSGGVCGVGACRHDTDAASSDLKDKLLAAVRLTVEANHICAAMEQRVAFEVELGVQVTGAADLSYEALVRPSTCCVNVRANVLPRVVRTPGIVSPAARGRQPSASTAQPPTPSSRHHATGRRGGRSGGSGGSGGGAGDSDAPPQPAAPAPATATAGRGQHHAAVEATAPVSSPMATQILNTTGGSVRSLRGHGRLVPVAGQAQTLFVCPFRVFEDCMFDLRALHERVNR